MNILVVEDEVYKLNNIIKALNNDFDNPNIVIKDTRNDALICLNNNMFDLIVLDWNFPIIKGGLPETCIGEEFLYLMERLDINIPVIICSSMHIEGNYPNVIGIKEYNPMEVLSFKDVLGKGR